GVVEGVVVDLRGGAGDRAQLHRLLGAVRHDVVAPDAVSAEVDLEDEEPDVVVVQVVELHDHVGGAHVGVDRVRVAAAGLDGGAGDLVVLHGGDIGVVEFDPAGADLVDEVVLHHAVAHVGDEYAVGAVGGALLGDVVAFDRDVGERRVAGVGRGAGHAPSGRHGARRVAGVLLEDDSAPGGVLDRGVLDGDVVQDRRCARR